MQLTYEQKQKLLEVFTRPGNNSLDALSMLAPEYVFRCMNCTVDNLATFAKSSGFAGDSMKVESHRARTLAQIFDQLAAHLYKHVNLAEEHLEYIQEKSE